MIDLGMAGWGVVRSPPPLYWRRCLLEKVGRVALCVKMSFFFNLLNQDNLTPLPTMLNSASTLDQAVSVRRLSCAGSSRPHRL